MIITRTKYRPDILFCEDEEIGGIGSSKFARSKYVSHLTDLKYLVDLDRANDKDAVYYDRRPSKYMKALIEEYASHTAFQREAFYFQEWITLAETAADAGKLLRFTTSNSRNELVIWDMRVYGVFPNEAGLFHYIVGRCVRKGGIKSDERIASFRISRMNEVKILSTASSRSGNLSKAEKKEIEAKIAHDGVQFLVGKSI